MLLHLPRRSASGEGIVVLGVCVSVCVCPPSRDCKRIALVSTATVMRCIQCSLVKFLPLQVNGTYLIPKFTRINRLCWWRISGCK